MSLVRRAVLVGHDEMLNLTRRWILERAGYAVTIAQRTIEIELLPIQERIDLLILCYMLTSEECLQAIGVARSAWPAIQPLRVQRRDRANAELPLTDVLLSTDGPEELFQTAQRLLRQLNGGEAVV